MSDIQKPIIKVLGNGFSVILLFSLIAVAMFGDDPSTGFHTFPSAVQQLIALSSFDNYSDLTENASVPMFLFVIAFVTVGHIFLMSVVLDITINFYTDAEKDQLKSERKKELQGLVKAFSYLDPSGTGIISYREYKHLLSFLRPDVTPVESRLLYEISASREDPKNPLAPVRLDVIDFAHIRKILGIRFSRRSRSTVVQAAGRLVATRGYSGLVFLACVANVLALGVKAVEGFSEQPLANQIHIATVCIMAVDLVLQSTDLGFQNFLHQEGTTAYLIVVVQNMLIHLLAPALPVKILNISDSITAYTVLVQNDTLHKWTWVFLKMMPMLFDVWCFVFMILFALTVILLEIGVSDSPYEALKLTFRILLGSDWSGTMFEAAQWGGVFTTMLFVFAYVLLNMVCFNLMVALVMGFENQVDTLQEQSKMRPIRVDETSTSSYLAVFVASSESWRKKVLDHESDVTKDDLKACAKYHKKCNLLEVFQKRNEERAIIENNKHKHEEPEKKSGEEAIAAPVPTEMVKRAAEQWRRLSQQLKGQQKQAEEESPAAPEKKSKDEKDKPKENDDADKKEKKAELKSPVKSSDDKENAVGANSTRSRVIPTPEPATPSSSTPPTPPTPSTPSTPSTLRERRTGELQSP